MEVLEINIAAKPTNKWAEYIPMSILNMCEKVDMVGSFYTCNPTPDTDIDIILLSKTKWQHLMLEFIDDESWDIGGSGEMMGDGFQSFRRGKVNAIVVKEKDMFDKFIIARDVCKALNLMNKQDRIKVHDIIMGKDDKYGF